MLRKYIYAVVIIVSCVTLNSCQKTADDHYNNSMDFVKAKDFNSAIIELDKAIEINPKYAKAYLDRGRYRFNLQFFNAVVNSNIDDSVKLGSLFESSVKDFNKVIELDLALVKDALIGRGHAYMALKKYNKASSDFEEVLKKDSSNKQITGITVHCKLLLKDTVGAKLLMDRIIGISPNDAENYYGRAIHRLISFNNKIGACEDLKKAEELYNQNEKYLEKDLIGKIKELQKINCNK